MNQTVINWHITVFIQMRLKGNFLVEDDRVTALGMCELSENGSIFIDVSSD